MRSLAIAMSAHIDTVIGPLRAAALVNSYRCRLRLEDNLTDQAALRVACTAYAWSSVYLIAHPGQTWQSKPENTLGLERLTIEEVGIDTINGHFALCRLPCGLNERLPLDQLDRRYILVSWPEETST